MDKNAEFWPLEIITTSDNTYGTIEHDVSIPAPPYMDNKAHQIITLLPEKLIVIENQTIKSITGIKTITLLSDSMNSTKTDNRRYGI